MESSTASPERPVSHAVPPDPLGQILSSWEAGIGRLESEQLGQRYSTRRRSLMDTPGLDYHKPSHITGTHTQNTAPDYHGACGGLLCDLYDAWCGLCLF